jgi:hypothetical protein
MFPPQIREIGVISFLYKEILAVVAAIADVIEISTNKRWNIGWHAFYNIQKKRPDT